MLLLIGVWVMSILWFGSDDKQHSLSSDIIVIVSWVLVGVGIPVLFLTMKLETEVRARRPLRPLLPVPPAAQEVRLA